MTQQRLKQLKKSSTNNTEKLKEVGVFIIVFLGLFLLTIKY